MTILKHESFPDGYANLIRHFDYWRMGETSLKFPSEEYPADARPEEWLSVVGKRAKQHRPIILMLDDGIKENSIRTTVMRELGCSFIVLARKWSAESFNNFSWRILRHWPTIHDKAIETANTGRLCKIEVSINGKFTPTNL